MDALESLHSGLTFKLQSEVIEAEYLFQARGHAMTAQAAASSHPQVDISKSPSNVKSLFYDMLSSMPYFTQGGSGGDIVQQEREEAVEKYKEYRRTVLAESNVPPVSYIAPVPVKGRD